ncbi:hypothetical protein [Nitrospina watsonii]|uniref:DUF4376 domain-containing protein n=1 Tax=Nitrospina watsonii TaxID=1323948 RepID=A0ABM9HHA5_9BACT|nr:hypothetical protein [Nitrospina watsonii]CAI2719735.1 exported protein of unknown function [Nitrospina watsonii]
MRWIVSMIAVLSLWAGPVQAAPYQALRSGGYLDMETGAVIPADPGNRHYRQVQAWIADGNTPVMDVPSEQELSVAIEKEADRRILAVTGGDTRQKQMLARSNELLLNGIVNGSFTPAEQDEIDQLKTANAWIKSVRQAAQAAATTLPGLTDSEKIAFDVGTDVNWPVNP